MELYQTMNVRNFCNGKSWRVGVAVAVSGGRGGVSVIYLYTIPLFSRLAPTPQPHTHTLKLIDVLHNLV
jgi:hypothetical protein